MPGFAVEGTGWRLTVSRRDFFENVCARCGATTGPTVPLGAIDGPVPPDAVDPALIRER